MFFLILFTALNILYTVQCTVYNVHGLGLNILLLNYYFSICILRWPGLFPRATESSVLLAAVSSTASAASSVGPYAPARHSRSFALA
jgi:hypothetical protein